MHAELSYYQKNKNRFKDVDTYFEKLYCNLYNLYTNDLKKFYEMIKDNSKDKKQIIEIINQVINYYSNQEKFENCQELLDIRLNISGNIELIFD